MCNGSETLWEEEHYSPLWRCILINIIHINPSLYALRRIYLRTDEKVLAIHRCMHYTLYGLTATTTQRTAENARDKNFNY
jgi:hypothetical protein